MIVSMPTFANKSRQAINCYNRTLTLNVHISKKVNFASQNWHGIPQALDHPILILLTEKDAKGILYTHDDALIITLKVATGEVARAHVDICSSIDIILKSMLD